MLTYFAVAVAVAFIDAVAVAFIDAVAVAVIDADADAVRFESEMNQVFLEA